MTSLTSFPFNQEVAPASFGLVHEKHDVSIELPAKDPEELRVDSFEIIATDIDGDTEATSHASTKAIRRKASIQFAVMCMGNFVCGWNAGVVGPLGPRLLEAYHVGYSLLSISFSMMSIGRIFGATTFEYFVDRIGFGVVW
uniref:Cytochrome P450 monooxygenase CYP52X1 n=1 Tax=Ganoderma boninense TaxID=34458 RepID=A0A5K1K8G2_9APHY|nr:Cytochrome P450 monooxygenase CYP52X1 [Ganoderma boninense]